MTSIPLPSGKLTANILLWKITIFNGKIHYKWPCSIAMLNYQRVNALWNLSFQAPATASTSIHIQNPVRIPVRASHPHVCSWACENCRIQSSCEHRCHRWGSQIIPDHPSIGSNIAQHSAVLWTILWIYIYIIYNIYIFIHIHICSQYTSQKGGFLVHGPWRSMTELSILPAKSQLWMGKYGVIIWYIRYTFPKDPRMEYLPRLGLFGKLL